MIRLALFLLILSSCAHKQVQQPASTGSTKPIKLVSGMSKREVSTILQISPLRVKNPEGEEIWVYKGVKEDAALLNGSDTTWILFPSTKGKTISLFFSPQGGLKNVLSE